MTTNAKNRAADTGPVHHKTVLPATDNATPTTSETIAQLAAELDREPSPWWQGYEYGHACGYAAALATVRRRAKEAERQAAADDGAEPMGKKAFGEAMDRAGYPAVKGTKGMRIRRGLGLLSADDADS